MNILHTVVCEIVPDMLRSVPIPKSFGGIFRLSFKDIIALTAFGSLSGALGYAVYTTAMLRLGKIKAPVNYDIKKHITKCVDIVDIENITEKKVYCRCWRSSKFPLCDGTHNKHNEETGDNVGPLIIETKKSA
uniref:CDGSH iron-sulfur domain-containing protein 2 homologue n=1 Tax=Trichobilharzia regenti TaxID=157069 RepID=A0AA85IZ89_TRIRE|nr:unnamed protein product [Trichobilharzia regenti]